MGSIPEYEAGNRFDSSMYHPSFFTGSHTLMPIDAPTPSAIGNRDFGTSDAHILQPVLMPQMGEWALRNVALSTTQWPEHHQNLQLDTNFSPETMDTKPPVGLFSNDGGTIHSGAYTGDVAINPSQLSSEDPTSPRKRFSHEIMGSDAPKRHKRAKSGAKVAKASTSELESADEEVDEKREKFLARNRVAASKCRQKKKEWTGQLEDKARELSNQRNYLTATVNMLRNELLELKCRCLEHSDCDCGRIRDYLKSTVAALSPTSSLYYDSTVNGTTISLDEPRRPSTNSVASFSWSDQATGSTDENFDTAES